MSQNTYLRSNFLNKVNIFTRIQNLKSWIISPALTKPLLKIVLGHKIFILCPISKLFAAHFATNSGLKIGQKIFCPFISVLIIIQENAFSEASFRTIVADHIDRLSHSAFIPITEVLPQPVHYQSME